MLLRPAHRLVCGSRRPGRRCSGASTYSGVAQVCTVQALLVTLGELPGSRTVDGRYDKQVRDALAGFQRGSGLDATGLLNPETLSQLASDALDVIFAGAPAAPTNVETAPVSDTVAVADDDSATQAPAPRPASAGRDTTAATTTSTAAVVTTSEATTTQSASAADGVATATDSSVAVTGSRLSASIGDSSNSAESQTSSAAVVTSPTDTTTSAVVSSSAAGTA